MRGLIEKYQRNREEFWRIFRFLLSGGWNTLFGIIVYTLLVCFPWGKEHYLIMAVPGNIIAITNAFLCYKLFVFKTKGNWLREYFKCYVVYGGGAVIGMALLYIFTNLLGLHPAISQFPSIAIITVCSYFGHKLFSFRHSEKGANETEKTQNGQP